MLCVSMNVQAQVNIAGTVHAYFPILRHDRRLLKSALFTTVNDQTLPPNISNSDFVKLLPSTAPSPNANEVVRRSPTPKTRIAKAQRMTSQPCYGQPLI